MTNPSTIHSLEGWRAHLAHRPEPPKTMKNAAYAKLTEPERIEYDEKRIDHISAGVTIATPSIKQVINETQLLILANRRQPGANQGVILSGPPTTGKTTALLALGEEVEARHRLRNPNLVSAPVAYVSLPPQATPKTISLAVVAFFGLYPTPRTTVQELTNAAIRHLQTQHNQVLMIDEIHNLRIGTKVGAEASDFLKHLADQTNTTMVYSGVDIAGTGLFDGIRGRQIAGRFTLVEATPFGYASQQQRQTWNSLVAAFEANLPLMEHTYGSLAKGSAYLYNRTSGHIGSLANLLRKAAILAIVNQSERIDRDLLDTVAVDFAAHRATTTSMSETA